jgi:hypothetical protein
MRHLSLLMLVIALVAVRGCTGMSETQQRTLTGGPRAWYRLWARRRRARSRSAPFELVEVDEGMPRRHWEA